MEIVEYLHQSHHLFEVVANKALLLGNDVKSVVYKAETRECPKIEALWATADVEKSRPNNMRLTVKISPSDKIKYRYVYVVVANSMKSKVLVFKQFGIYTDKEKPL